MNATTWAWIGGIGGAVIGLAGGVIGTWLSLRAAAGPRERAHILKIVILLALVGILFAILMWEIPSPWNSLLWVAFGLFLPLVVTLGNREQERIRNEEKRAGNPQESRSTERDEGSCL